MQLGESKNVEATSEKDVPTRSAHAKMNAADDEEAEEQSA